MLPPPPIIFNSSPSPFLYYQHYNPLPPIPRSCLLPSYPLQILYKFLKLSLLHLSPILPHLIRFHHSIAFLSFNFFILRNFLPFQLFFPSSSSPELLTALQKLSKILLHPRRSALSFELIFVAIGEARSLTTDFIDFDGHLSDSNLSCWQLKALQVVPLVLLNTGSSFINSVCLWIYECLREWAWVNASAFSQRECNESATILILFLNSNSLNHPFFPLSPFIHHSPYLSFCFCRPYFLLSSQYFLFSFIIHQPLYLHFQFLPLTLSALSHPFLLRTPFQISFFLSPSIHLFPFSSSSIFVPFFHYSSLYLYHDRMVIWQGKGQRCPSQIWMSLKYVIV